MPLCPHPPVQAAKADVAEEIGELAEEVGMVDVLVLAKARVPVVKLVVPSTHTKVRCRCWGLNGGGGWAARGLIP